MRTWNKKRKPKHYTKGKWRYSGLYMYCLNMKKKTKRIALKNGERIVTLKWLSVFKKY